MATVGTVGAIPEPPPTAGQFGQGVKYPVDFDSNGRLKLSFGATSVEEALISIMRTYPGERVMQPDYGAGVMLFEPYDTSRIVLAIRESIEAHEPRVTQADVSVSQGQQVGEVFVTIIYSVAGDANPRTLTQGFFNGPATTSRSS